MPPELIGVIIQGGAVGLAAFALGIVWYAFRTMVNHMQHWIESQGQIVEILTKMDLHQEQMLKALGAQASTLDRIDRRLE